MSETDRTTELARNWSLTFSETEFLQQQPSSTWLDLAVQMLFFRQSGAFPSNTDEVSTSAVEYVNSQLQLDGQGLEWKIPKRRTLQRRRKEIREFYGIMPMTSDDEKSLREWLTSEHCQSSYNLSQI